MIDEIEVCLAQVGLISAHFLHIELFLGPSEEIGEFWTVCVSAWGDAYGGDDVGFRAARDVGFLELPPVALVVVFDVEPALKHACAETGAVDCEIGLNACQW